MANEKRLIDANEFFNRLRNTVYDTPTDFGYTPGLIKAVLERTRTVDAVPVVHGHWIDGYAVDSTGKKVYDSIDCSVCEDIFKIEYHDREYWKARFKSCPFCWALMDEVDEDG